MDRLLFVYISLNKGF